MELVILPAAMTDGSYAMLADVVWPSLFLARRLFSWTIIGAGLVIELGFVLWLTRATLARAGLMTLTMNAVSTAVGLIGIPLSGVIWELIASVTILPLFHWGTFNPVTWGVSCILAALLSTAIETASLRLLFKVTWTRKLLWWLFVANLITVGMAMVSIVMRPPQT